MWAIAKKDIRIYYAKGPVLIFGILVPAFFFLAFTMGRDLSGTHLASGLLGMALWFTATSISPVITPCETRDGTLERLVSAPVTEQEILLGDVLASAVVGAAITMIAAVALVPLLDLAVPHPLVLAAGVVLAVLGFSALRLLLATIPTDRTSNVMMLSTLVKFPVILDPPSLRGKTPLDTDRDPASSVETSAGRRRPPRDVRSRDFLARPAPALHASGSGRGSSRASGDRLHAGSPERRGPPRSAGGRGAGDSEGRAAGPTAGPGAGGRGGREADEGERRSVSSIRVLGTGSHVPPEVLTNQGLVEKGLDTSEEWIVRRTGIEERRIADPDVATSDLGLEAARGALERAQLEAADLDLIIVATITPDTCCPSAANWLQAALGAPQATSFDVTAACSGFVFGLDVARAYLESGACGRALVVAAEVMSRTLDWSDRSTCILWGDGAGAAVLGRGESGPTLLSTTAHSDGSRGEDLLLPGGGSHTTPISRESVEEGRHHLRMRRANFSFKVAVRHLADAVREAVEEIGLAVDEIDRFVPHQANLRLLEATARRLDVPKEKFYLTLHKYGNISSASCAIALDEAARDGTLQPGDFVCMPVFGGGITWGAAVMEW